MYSSKGKKKKTYNFSIPVYSRMHVYLAYAIEFERPGRILIGYSRFISSRAWLFRYAQGLPNYRFANPCSGQNIGFLGSEKIYNPETTTEVV